jgi:hypothetical protein
MVSILSILSILFLPIKFERRLLEKIPSCAVFLHLFEMDLPNYQYMMKYKIDYPATQIRYYVTNSPQWNCF